MKNTREAASIKNKSRAVASVLISYTPLIFVQSSISGIFEFFRVSDGTSGAAADFFAYLSGIIISCLIYKYTAGFMGEGQHETIYAEIESGIEASESEAPVPHARYIFYTSGALALMLFVNICFAYFSEGSGASAHDSLIFSAAVGILIKSPLEEALFRGAYLKRLTSTLDALPSVFLVSILFGAWHPTGSRIFASVSGVILGALYLGIRKLTYNGKSYCAFICTSLCHALFNAAMYAAECADIYFNFSVFGTVCVVFCLAALIFAVSAAVLIVKNHRHAVR